MAVSTPWTPKNWFTDLDVYVKIPTVFIPALKWVINSPSAGNPTVESTEITVAPAATLLIILVLGWTENSPKILPSRGISNW